MSEERALGLLRALCSGLAAGTITVVADDTVTAFAPKRKQILVARRFLLADTPVAIGALLHEIGHALVTRYDLFAEPEDVPHGLWWQAQNAVEESRVHRFLRGRLPGAGGYLDQLFAMDDPPGPEAFESELVVFLAATATWDRHASLPFLDSFPTAAAAFHRTEPARTNYMRTLPPSDLMPQPDLDERYRGQVVPVLEAQDFENVVPLEAEVRCAAAAALRVFRAEIWPEIMALAARDHARIVHSLSNDPHLRAALQAEEDRLKAGNEGSWLARRALRAWMREHGLEAVPESPPDDEYAKAAWDIYRQYLEGIWAVKQHRRSSQSLRSMRDLLSEVARRMLQAERLATTHRVSEDDEFSLADGEIEEIESDEALPAHTETNRAPETLVEVLRQALPRRRPRWTSGYRSGTAIDLDRVMRAAATGRDGDRIWLRRIPGRPALAALLLVDLSGSMSGAKIEAAVAATRALSAAMAEVHSISWSVLGFQDVIIPFVRFEETADPYVLARIGEMSAEVEGKRKGGHNVPGHNDDGPCLLEAAAILQKRPEQDRLLIVISDGSPHGMRSSADDLHQAVAQVQAMPGMTLVGLGIGLSTEHVTSYYPVSQANLELGDLAPAIARLLTARLRAAAA